MNGLTMVIDPGLATGAFTDVIGSHGEHIGLVKFGWGTALVTRDLDRKVAGLREAGIGFYFGGALLPVRQPARRVPRTGGAHRRHPHRGLQRDHPAGPARQGRPGAADGAVPAGAGRGRLQGRRTLGAASPADWVAAIGEGLDAGATLVITETRESGRNGIARPDGHLRDEVLHAVLAAIDPGRLLFEAPTKDLQVQLIRELGPQVNLGNIAAADVLGVATLRIGLRADSLLQLATRRIASASVA